MNLDAISRAANENTDPDPSDRDFGELMANALRVCLDDLLANRGPMTDEQRKAMFARLGGGGGGDRQSIGNRAPSTLLETAIRVARTPDAVLANARRPLTDEQKRAIFAKERSGGGGGHTTAAGTWTPQGGFVPHSPEALQAMASTRAQIAFNKQVGQQLFERELAGLKGGGEMVGIQPMPGRGDDPLVGIPKIGGPGFLGSGDLNFAGGSPYFDEKLGRYLTPQETEAKNAQIAELLAKINGQPPAPQPPPAPAPEPVAPPPEWRPQPQPGGGSGLVGVQPAMPPATYVPPQPQPQPQPAPQPVPPAPDPQPEPEPQPESGAPPTGGGQSGGTPSWSVPGYGDPALPSRLGRTVVPGTDQPPKGPQITPAMLERLRKRIAGEM